MQRLFKVLYPSCLVVLLTISQTIYAWDYAATGQTTEQAAQLQIGAEFTKKWDCGVHLSLSEERALRFSAKL